MGKIKTARAQKNQRNSISQKIRFNVFKRDGFVCQYCGSAPPGSILEIDHIEPVSQGGSNDVDNLITSCFDCNRGKGAEQLSVSPKNLEQKAEVLKEKEAQLRGYRRLLATKKRRENHDITVIQSVFQETFPKREFTDDFKHSIRINFLPSIEADYLHDYMRKACWKMKNPDSALKYFCGTCWRVMRGQ